jgi:hypothetical protein
LAALIAIEDRKFVFIDLPTCLAFLNSSATCGVVAWFAVVSCNLPVILVPENISIGILARVAADGLWLQP